MNRAQQFLSWPEAKVSICLANAANYTDASSLSFEDQDHCLWLANQARLVFLQLD